MSRAIKLFFVGSTGYLDMAVCMRFEAILFDYYKTLVVPKYPESEAVRNFLRDLQRRIESGEISISSTDINDVEESFRWSIGFFETIRSATGIDVSVDLLIRTLTTRLGIYREDDVRRVLELYTYHLVESVEPPLDTFLAIKEFRSMGFKLAVVSNAHQIYFIKEGLRKYGLIRFLDAIIISGEVGLRKPFKNIFLYATSTLGVRADKCVMIGDNIVSDFIGSLQAGMYPILIARDDKTYELYSQVIKKEHIIRELTEALEIVKQQ